MTNRKNAKAVTFVAIGDVKTELTLFAAKDHHWVASAENPELSTRNVLG
jgi:hypothetical protein